MCDNKEALVGFIYGELGPAEQHAFERHLAECAECRSEVVALQATRGQLASWAPPDADLEFRIVRGGVASPVRRVFTPVWGLAAAAVLVLAAAAALANVEVKYGSDGVTVRTGWGRADMPLAAEDRVADGANVVTRAELAALDRRLREFEAAAAERDRVSAQAAQTGAGPQASDAEILRRVRAMIGEAQTEQQRQVAALLAQVVKDFDRQRRVDLAAFQQGLSQVQGMTNLEIARTQDVLNQWLIRTAATRQEK